MPSFCWPFGLGPKPAMTRPFTGQRNVGVASALIGVGGGVSSLRVTTAACSDCSGCFGAGVALAGWALGVAALPAAAALADAAALPAAAALADGAAKGCDPFGVLLAMLWEAGPPGMTMRSPIFSVAVGSMLLALPRSATE